MAFCHGRLPYSIAAHAALVVVDPLVDLSKGLDQPGLSGAAWDRVFIPVLGDDHASDGGDVYRFG
jgi:hypothetical protein